MRQRRFAVWLICVLGVGGLVCAGCDKKKNKTTPDARRARAGSGPSSPTDRESGSRAATPPRRALRWAMDPRPGDSDPRRPAIVAPPHGRPVAPSRPPPVKIMTVAQIKALIAAKQYDQAISEAKKVLEQHEGSVPAMAAMAMAYYRKGELELCRAVLAAINLQEKNNALYLYLWGHLHLREKNYALSQKYFERAVAKNPRLLDAWLVIGVRHLRGGSYQKALTALLRAKGLAGGNTYATNLNIGSTYRGLAHRTSNPQHFVTALNYYAEAEKIFRQQPGNATKPYLNALYNKAILFLDASKFPGYTKVRRLEQGLNFLQQYATLAPRYAPGKWQAESKEVMRILNKVKNADLPAARAMAKAAASAPPRPRVVRPPRRNAPAGPAPR